MAAPRGARSTWARLIEAGKIRSGREWSDIDGALSIKKQTREQWMNGRVEKPPLEPMTQLARELGITGDEMYAAILEDVLPGWAILALDPPPLTEEEREALKGLRARTRRGKEEE